MEEPFLKMDPCKLASFFHLRSTYVLITDPAKSVVLVPGVREKHHFSHHFLVQALFGL